MRDIFYPQVGLFFNEMKKSLNKSIKKIDENIFLKFVLQQFKSRIHLGKVTLDKTVIPSFPSPHQLYLSKDKRTNIEGCSVLGLLAHIHAYIDKWKHGYVCNVDI